MKFNPADHSIIAWILQNNIKTETGRPFDLKTHGFLFDLLTDRSPNIVCLKSAQIGGSTSVALKMLWNMKRYGLNCAYTAPTDGDAQEFVGGKLNPIIRVNKVLDDWIQDKDSVMLKRIGKNSAYFRGTMTERTALSFSADLLIHDELDRSNRQIIEQYASRLQHSDYKWTWALSNPSTPGNGVDALWKLSDQKHFFIACQSCSKKQYLSWPESICLERKIYQCKHCHNELSEEARRKGEWIGVKTETKPLWSGFWFSLLMASWTKASEIIELNRTKSPEYFANFVLGLPYAGTGSKLNEDEFFQNLTSGLNGQEDPVVIGVDTGIPYWVVIGNKQGVFYNGQCAGIHDIEQMLHRFPKAIVVMDGGGDITAPRELREKYPGRVYLCWFRQDRKAMRLIEWGRGKEVGKVIADRNRCIQQLMDELRDNRIPLWGDRSDWQECWTHFANMYRTTDEDALGQPRNVWESVKPDHLTFAMLYWRIGMDKFQTDGARSVGGFDLSRVLDVQASFENVDGRMPAKFPHTETQDWRSL